MPARVIDGDAIAGSDKLLLVPEQFRLHYAYWLTMQEANGVFESKSTTIWRKLYSLLMPSITPEVIAEIKTGFLNAKLLVVWQEGDKEYGYFPGSEKPGRLPSKEHQRRYKNLPPNPPEKCIRDMENGKSLKTVVPDNSGSVPGDSGNMPDGFGFGLDLVRYGFGVDKTENQPLPLHPVSEETDSENLSEDDPMSAKKHISAACLKVLGLKAEPYDNVWREIQELVEAFGMKEVRGAFDDWVESRAGEIEKYPVGEFLKVAPGILRGTIEVTENPKTKSLLDKMVFESQGKILFEQKHRAILSRLLKTFSADEILSAFRKFFAEQTTDFDMKHGARKFCDIAEQLVTLERSNRAYLDAQEALNRKLQERERQKVQKELEKSKSVDNDEFVDLE